MKYILGATILSISALIPFASAQAAGLTSQQANSLIAVVQSSPGTPASVFVPLITSFSNITVNQAISLIAVVQTAPGVPANAFVNLLISFTADTLTTQVATQTTNQEVTPKVTPVTAQPTIPSTQPILPSLTATKNTSWGNQSVAAGASNVKIGSFTLSPNVVVTVFSIYLDIVGNANVTNLMLRDNSTGNLLSEVRTTPTMPTDNNFSVNLQILAGETQTINIHGNIPSGVTGTIQTTLNTKTEGILTNSSTGISPASAVPLQTITVVDNTPKITFSFNGIGNTTNTYTATVSEGVRLGWSSNTNYCKASGDWSGEKSGGNSENITFDHAGVFNYTLTCLNNAAEKGTNTAVITVNQ